MRVLLVDVDQKRVEPLKDALADFGHEVAVASSGSFALTMLEWNQQDVIISRARIHDMDGHELCAILRSDPATKAVPFVLLADGDEVTAQETAEAGVDVVLSPNLGVATIMVRALELGSRDLAEPEPPTPVLDEEPARPTLESVPPEPTLDAAAMKPTTLESVPPESTLDAPAPRPTLDLDELPGVEVKGPGGVLQGSLDVSELPEIARALAARGKTGRLIVSLARGGMIVFESGRIVHATFGDAFGERAVAALLAASRRETGSRFCFLPIEAEETSKIPRTIAKTVDELLLSGTAMEEGGRAIGRPERRFLLRSDEP